MKFAYLKQLHVTGQRKEAIAGLQKLVDECQAKGWAETDIPLMVRVHLRLGLWTLQLSDDFHSGGGGYVVACARKIASMVRTIHCLL